MRTQRHHAERNRITRLMRHIGLVGVHRRTDSTGLTHQDRMAQAPPDLVNRDFTASAPDVCWSADITVEEKRANSELKKWESAA